MNYLQPLGRNKSPAQGTISQSELSEQITAKEVSQLRHTTSTGAVDRLLPLWETDFFVGLFRTAFIIAFVIAGTFSPFDPQAHRFVWILLIVATVFTTVLFVSLARGRPLPHRRLIALVIDLLLVSAAILLIGPGQQQSLFQVYYLIVLIGAIWFQLVGSLCTAAAALVLFTLVKYVATYPTALGNVASDVLWDQGALFLLLIALIGGFLVRALDRQYQATAQFTHELQLARTVQDTILSASLPQLPGWQVALRFEPARWVGGDLYEVAKLADGQYLVYLGDMPGKSAYGLVHLSLIYSQVRGAAFAGLAPAAIANRINQAVYDVLQPYSYAPLFIGMLQSDTGKLTFVSCGHHPPVLLRADGSYEKLSSDGIVIGGRHDANYQQRETRIQPGDLLICYTDGIIEPRNRAGEEFGVQRVIQVARSIESAGGSIEEISDEILRQSHKFSAEWDRDDATLILLRREPGNAPQ